MKLFWFFLIFSFAVAPVLGGSKLLILFSDLRIKFFFSNIYLLHFISLNYFHAFYIACDAPIDLGFNGPAKVPTTCMVSNLSWYYNSIQKKCRIYVGCYYKFHTKRDCRRACYHLRFNKPKLH